MEERKRYKYVDDSDYEQQKITVKSKKSIILKKIIFVAVITIILITAGKYLYDKTVEHNKSVTPDPMDSVIDYHEKQENFKILIIELNSKLKKEKKYDLESFNFYKKENNDLIVTIKVQTNEGLLSRYKEYTIPNVETDNFEEIIEIIKNYDFTWETKTRIELTEPGIARTVYEQCKNISEKIKSLVDDGWTFQTSIDSYYDYTYDENYKYSTCTIGGWYKFEKGKSVKYFHYEFVADDSDMYFNNQNMFHLIRNGKIYFKESLIIEMDENYGKSKYLGKSGFIEDFTKTKENILE